MDEPPAARRILSRTHPDPAYNSQSQQVPRHSSMLVAQGGVLSLWGVGKHHEIPAKACLALVGHGPPVALVVVWYADFSLSFSVDLMFSSVDVEYLQP